MFYVRVVKNGYTYRINIEDDSKLQQVMDLCHKHFGKPGEVLNIPRVLPEPKEKRRAKRGT